MLPLMSVAVVRKVVTMEVIGSCLRAVGGLKIMLQQPLLAHHPLKKIFPKQEISCVVVYKLSDYFNFLIKLELVNTMPDDARGVKKLLWHMPIPQ